MATIYDVAKRAKVSTYTVSAVLNRSAFVSPELTRRVQKAVLELDYTINELARSLQTRKTRTVGMLIPDIANPFYAKVVRGVEDVLSEAGYSLLLGNTYDKEEEQGRYLTLFRAKQVDGLLLFHSPGDLQDLMVLVKAKKPIIFVGRLPSFSADGVAADNVKGAEMAVQHLIARKHRRIAVLTGPAELSTSADRVSGWKRALKKAGLQAPQELIGEGDWTAESAHLLCGPMLDNSARPTAIFASNFLMMTGVLRALKERHLRCPEDVEVVSSDDSDWLDVFEPRVSTVAQPSYAMGTNAAELLLKRIESPGRRFERIVLEPELRIRV